MPAVNFTVLLSRIMDGRKQQTIRLHRRDGSSCYWCKMARSKSRVIMLYTGLRTKAVRLLGRGIEPCFSVIKPYNALSPDDAKQDGFDDYWQEDLCGSGSWLKICGNKIVAYECQWCTAYRKLQKFLEANYEPDEATGFHVISWKDNRQVTLSP